MYIECNQCTALSNMPLRHTEKYMNNMLLTHFNTTSGISLYHATIVVSSYPLRVYDTQNRYIQMWCRSESIFHIEFAKNVAEYFTMFWNHDWIQRLNDIPKVTHVAISNFPDSDIIIFGLIFYNEMDIVYDKNLYPVARKIEVSRLVGHKVTQQWFYNLSNPCGSAFCFNKALTTWLTTYALNLIYPDNGATNLFVVQNQHTSFYLDDYDMWNSTSQDDSLLKIRESIRAPCILRMIQHAVTKEIFWKGIRLYTNTQFHRQSFMTFLEEVVADAKNVDIDISLQTMKYWTSEKHCPIIRIERDYNFTWDRMHISIQNYDILKIDCLLVTYTTQTYPNFNDLTEYNYIKVCNSTNSYSVYLYDDGWVIVNMQQIVIAGQLKASTFWNIISYLGQEEDYIAWYPMFKALEYMFNTFPAVILKESNSSYMKRIRVVLNKVLRRIKYEEIDDTDEFRICLRQETARWACFFGDIICTRQAKNKLEYHLQDPKEHRLCHGGRHGHIVEV
ncbi:leucyl-cystinyl aminopeptidase-like isoform X2 [Nylanderia fulva]|uniref:leucyl-cystinyl aminopeptidase-like isoform X2 n=1 Tax=Nylanderia fulva TaxID=613905 RepID=UPI0010FB2BFB|nr:leucyl-cystinyl aminopeptidase-like isoform X2 [Nylanderia fulva]